MIFKFCADDISVPLRKWAFSWMINIPIEEWGGGTPRRIETLGYIYYIIEEKGGGHKIRLDGFKMSWVLLKLIW